MEQNEENLSPLGNLPAPVTRKPQPKEIHRQAFDYYLSLGPGRTLARVTEKFGKKPQEISRWAKTYDWFKRIDEFEGKSLQEQTIEKADRFLNNQIEILLMKQAEIVEPDPSDSRKLTLTDKATVSTLKELTNSALVIIKAIAEKVGIKNAEKKFGDGSRASKGLKTGVMVNVIFKGIDESK
jgi:hypothetical protein